MRFAIQAVCFSPRYINSHSISIVSGRVALVTRSNPYIGACPSLSIDNRLRSTYFAPPFVFRRSMAFSAAANRLAGKTILITGASSGIGRSTALEFARTNPKGGLRLIITARRIDILNELATEIEEKFGDGVKVLPIPLDVSNPNEVRGFVEQLPEDWRDIHILVNNA